jgi:tRNA threonylcarbamoyladenosine biosynthesis protein TsaB
MTLYIDTTEAVVVKLLQAGQEVGVIQQDSTVHRQAQTLLADIDHLLRQYSVELSQITAIEVVCGPGSFTGTRVGVAAANSLALALSIPINGQPASSFVSPIYASAPNISQKRRT